jgi:hypothetical protein
VPSPFRVELPILMDVLIWPWTLMADPVVDRDWVLSIDVNRDTKTKSYSTIEFVELLKYMSEERLERIENQLSQVIQ